MSVIKKSAGIIGLGYVGLPLAVAFCRAGFRVTGLDVDAGRVNSLMQGKSYIGDVADDDIKELLDAGAFSASSDFAALSEVEGICVCVPTPLRKTKEPDVSFVSSAAEDISGILRQGQVIILESTVYPGATDELVAPILEKSGLKAGEDFFLAFSPERVDPGRAVSLRDIPKLVGGVNQCSTRKAAQLYQSVFKTVVPMTSAREAEMAKLLENTFRAVNIGLVNELALMSHSLGINIWEVIEAASTKPYGFMPFYPGPGWGGHCIPIDPVYLSWSAKAEGLETGFIDHAVQINNQMPRYVVERVADLLNQEGKPLHNSRVLVLGVAYKKDVGDLRESPALSILSFLERKRVKTEYHDPYVPCLRHDGMMLESRELTRDVLHDQDCVVIATDHGCVDYDFVAENSHLVFDTRNATRDIRGRYPNIHLL